MSLWTETLRYAVVSEHYRVRQMLVIDLPRFLREPSAKRGNNITTSYQGPAVKAVLNFVRHLEPGEAQMARSRIDDFIDFVVDQVIAKIERTVRLALFCV